MVRRRGRSLWGAGRGLLLLLFLLFLGLALVLTLLFDRSFPIDSDEGYTLGAAWQLWNGRRMYDDFRLFVGPGCGYSVFWLWKLLGVASHRAARLLAVGFAFSSTVALTALLKRIGVRPFILAFAVLVWLVASALYVPLSHNSFSSYAALWFLLPFWSLLRPEGDARAATPAVLAGLAAGAAFVFLPTKGGLLTVASAATLFSMGVSKRAFRPTLVFLASFAAVTAPLCLRWRPATLIHQWLVIPLAGNYLGHTGASRGALVLALALVVGMGGVALRMGDRLLTVLAVVQASLFASITHNMELHHLAINAFPAVIFAAVALDRRLPRPSRLLAFPAEAVLATVAATVIAWTVLSPVGAALFTGSTFDVDLLGRGSKPFRSRRLDAAHAIYAGPFLPGLYYLLGKTNPFFVSETVVCDEACHRQLVEELQTVRPELAFLNYAMIRHLDYDQNAPVDVFLRQRYVRCPDRGFFTVLALDADWCP